ncbi:MAG: tail fiber protein [Nevskia sp.]|nr:tail fiber protein [Nevskia sp.]
MSDQYVGEIRMFGCNFAPYGWALCNGQILSIESNTALFSILGTFYGGDGVNTFGLPDLRGVAPAFYGQGPGLASLIEGERDTVGATTRSVPTAVSVARNMLQSTTALNPAPLAPEPTLVMNFCIAVAGNFPDRS